MEIHSNANSLDMLLSSFSRFDIPELQRPYAWQDAQVRDFVKDITDLVHVLEKDPQSSSEHLFGMVVTIGGANGPQSVVDGQQRLTTGTLAVAMLRDAYQRLHGSLEGGPQHELAITCLMKVAALRQLLYQDGGGGQPRLCPSNEIRLTYASLMEGGDGRVPGERLRPVVRLRAAVKIIRECLLENDDQFDLTDPVRQFQHYERVEKVLLKRLKFIHVRTTSPESGYGLFEALNTRGQRLNALDLVKVWVMSQLAGKEVELMVAKQFRGLANDNTVQELEFLRDYYRAQAFVSPDLTNEVTFATDVRKHLFKDPSLIKTDQAIETEQMIILHVDRMVSWFDLWNDLKDKTAPFAIGAGSPDAAAYTFANERLGLLLGSTLKHDLVMPLLLHLADLHTVPTFAAAVHDIERFFFRFKKLCGGQVAPLEKVYLNWCSKLAVAPKASLLALGQDLQKLLDLHAADPKFQARLCERLTFGKAGAPPLATYFFQTLELQRLDGELWNRQVSGRHVIEIECVEKGFDAPSDRLRLGNMMLVNDAEKQLLKGKSFAEKKSFVRTLRGGLSSFYAIEAFKASTWDTSALEHHEAALTKAACSAFSV